MSDDDLRKEAGTAAWRGVMWLFVMAIAGLVGATIYLGSR